MFGIVDGEIVLLMIAGATLIVRFILRKLQRSRDTPRDMTHDG